MKLKKEQASRSPKVVEFINISKQFGKIIANDKINFSIEKNEIHALLGENGAGKSTLMSILFGLYTPSSGFIKINGNIQKISSPKHANKLKIAMLPQHFKLVENMSVLENVMLGYEIVKKNGLLDKSAMIKKIELAKRKYKIQINIHAKVRKLSVSDKQKVELLKILWGEADILIFDEPTSILTPLEIQEFLKLLSDLKKAGKTVLLITHKLSEIKQIADRVSIIRKGKYIGTLNARTTNHQEMAKMMVGREVNLNLESIYKKPINKQLSVMRADSVNYHPKGFEKQIKNVSFKLKSGEILGIASIEGNGQDELMKILGGIAKPHSGEIYITGHSVHNKKAKDLYYTKEWYSDKDTALRVRKLNEKFRKNDKTKNITDLVLYLQYARSKKLAHQQNVALIHKKKLDEGDFYWKKKASLLSHIPEDRHKYGLILDYSAMKNAILQDLKYFTNCLGIISKKSAKLRLEHIIKNYDVRGVQSHKTPVRNLSGGNQQKLILGREIERGSNVLLAVHPTRGLDVGAIINIYEKIIETRNNGTGVILCSGELDEIMQVSDRIMVLFNGEIVSITEKGELNKIELGSLMSTGKIDRKLVENQQKKKLQQKQTQQKNKLVSKPKPKQVKKTSNKNVQVVEHQVYQISRNPKIPETKNIRRKNRIRVNQKFMRGEKWR